MPYKPNTPEDVWRYVDRRGAEDCWPWIGYSVKGGYGRFTVRGTHWSAHRLVYSITRGPVPGGMVVRHTCDNPPCCNPSHLIAGSPADNTADMMRRGRWKGGCPPGTKHPSIQGGNHYLSRLTPEDVRSIRRRREAGETLSGLARAYNLGYTTVRAIVTRRTWAWLDPPDRSTHPS